MFRFFQKDKPQPAHVEHEPVAHVDYELDVCLQSDVGCHRTSNEDSGKIVRAAVPGSQRILIAIADGMGGHQAGEIASQRAIDVVSRAYSDGAAENPLEGLTRAFEQANREIYQQAQQSAEFKGMGTTCTALALRDGAAYSAHVGDSRLYLIRDGEIYLMTEDHSAVMELVKQGSLTLDEARHHADKNVITRALGSRPEVQVSIWPEPFPVRTGDRFLICSDGLYDRIEDKELRDIAVSGYAAEACGALVEMAKQRGGYDNITVAIAGLSALPQERKGPPTTREMEVQA